jgi:hypothetical protein
MLFFVEYMLGLLGSSRQTLLNEVLIYVQVVYHMIKLL